MPTYPARDATERIDYVTASPNVTVERAGVPRSALYRSASDHRPVVADLTVTRGRSHTDVRVVRRTGTRYGDLVALPGGTFLMGTDAADGFPDDHEGPVRKQAVAPFAIGRCSVSNAEFADFVAETGYRTDAERFGWSYVFTRFLPADLRKVSPRPDEAPWWCGVGGRQAADRNRMGVRGEGRVTAGPLPVGDELCPGGRHMCNIWQGRFPTRNTVADGYAGTAPVDAFAPNGYGLYNISGNVWEWCADHWEDESDEDGPRVMRGGSYLCHESYCNRYRVAARTGNDPASGGGNNGFRIAADASSDAVAAPHRRESP